MKMQQPNTSRILVVCTVVVILAISISWVLPKLDPFPIMFAKGLHENAAFLALSICPAKECETRLGWGTKELPIDASQKMLQRWCVEVSYTRQQIRDFAALEIVVIDRDYDNPDNWKIVNTEYRAKCSTMK